MIEKQNENMHVNLKNHAVSRIRTLNVENIFQRWKKWFKPGFIHLNQKRIVHTNISTKIDNIYQVSYIKSY